MASWVRTEYVLRLARWLCCVYVFCNYEHGSALPYGHEGSLLVLYECVLYTVSVWDVVNLTLLQLVVGWFRP